MSVWRAKFHLTPFFGLQQFVHHGIQLCRGQALPEFIPQVLSSEQADFFHAVIELSSGHRIHDG